MKRFNLICDHLNPIENENNFEWIERSNKTNSSNSNSNQSSFKQTFSNVNEFKIYGNFILIQEIDKRSEELTRFRSIKPTQQIQNQRPRFAMPCVFELKVFDWIDDFESIIFQRSCYSDRLFSSTNANNDVNTNDVFVVVVCNEDQPSDFTTFRFFSWNSKTFSIHLKAKIWHCFFKLSPNSNTNTISKSNTTNIQCFTFEDQTDADFETFKFKRQ